MLDRQHRTHPLETLSQVIRVEDLVVAQAAIKEIHVSPPVKEYILSIVETTRVPHDDVYLGASPRGSLALYNTSRAWAALHGRDYVTPDDVKELAEATLAHRVIVSPSARMKNVDSRMVIHDILSALPVPGAQPGVQARPGWGIRRASE
jgi:MoxR-like ATPase